MTMTPHPFHRSSRSAHRTLAVALAVCALLATPAVTAETDPVWQAYQLEGVPRQVEELGGAARALLEADRFTDELKAVADAARSLDVTDLEAARADFEALSQAVARYAVARGLDVQTYYCPMKEASWLQPATDTGVENPYYGASMLTCGAPVEQASGPN